MSYWEKWFKVLSYKKEILYVKAGFVSLYLIVSVGKNEYISNLFFVIFQSNATYLNYEKEKHVKEQQMKRFLFMSLKRIKIFVSCV